MPTEILIIFALLLLNAFFALSEMAIVSSSKALLREFAKQGRGSALVALNLAENSGRFLSTVQVGITLVGILAGAYGGATLAAQLAEFLNQFPVLSQHGEGLSVLIVVSAVTYFSVVIGELVPKQVALNNPEQWAMWVARPMSLLSKICTPIVILLEGSAQVLLKLLRIKPKTEGVTETEIKAVIAEGVVSGAIDGEEHDVIRRVIRLGDRDVKSIMTHRSDVQFIDVDDTLAQVRAKIAEAGHSRYPVIDKDPTQILGVVKTKSMMAGAAEEAGFHVKDFMNEVSFINDNLSCLEALSIFRSESLHMAAVIDEYGAFEGLFTTSDLMEAIVGTIPSNYDHDDGPAILQREDGSWLVDGLTPIDEIHMTIGIEEIDANGDYQTIAGFILSQLRVPPAVGESFDFAEYRFEIIDMDGHRIDKILVGRGH
ncbi:MAG: HlyC/CorC family transporter [Alphaproteobacteria bacterium]|nr:HlyC/CorC family transporter [Alphaproteobacteria bacterium]